jgi:diacylglycerol kinase
MGKVIKHNFFQSRKQSYNHAVNGIKLLFKTQINFVIEVAACLIVVFLGLLFGLNTVEWCFIVISIFFVLISEAINSSLEFLSDKISEESSPIIKKVKDISAGAVLLSVISSIIIGLMVFIPKMKEFLN